MAFKRSGVRFPVAPPIPLPGHSSGVRGVHLRPCNTEILVLEPSGAFSYLLSIRVGIRVGSEGMARWES